MPPTRRCTGKTKAGKACKAAPLKDRNVCLAHADQETRESTGFGGSQAGAGRPRLPRPADVARRLIEQNELVLQRPYWRTLGYDVKLGPDGPFLVEMVNEAGEPIGGAKLYGESKDGTIEVSGHDDLGAMIAAAEKLQDRVYGKPKQTQEITGADGGPVEMVPVARERGPDVVRILAGTGVLPVPVPNGNGNGNGHAAHN